MKAGLDEAGLAAAAAALAAGDVVAIPTDTLYGLAVDPTRPGATDRLFFAKARPRHVPIAVLVADAEQAWELADPDLLASCAVDLAKRFWPGALTVVVGRSPVWPGDLGDSAPTVGLRCPDHGWVRALCRRVGPLATTSANLHGQTTPGEAAGVAALFGADLGVVIDGGTCVGEPSTVVDCTVNPPRVLRQGSVDLSLP